MPMCVYVCVFQCVSEYECICACLQYECMDGVCDFRCMPDSVCVYACMAVWVCVFITGCQARDEIKCLTETQEISNMLFC